MATKELEERTTARVRDEWLRRVEAEYRSAAIAQHLGLWLLQIGASPDLVSMSLRIVRDELAHAELSHRAHRAAGGREAPRIAQETLALPRHADDPLELDVARATVDVFCLGETLAVPLFAELRDGCTVKAARRVLDRVLRDEVRHRDFGWVLLDWLLAHPLGDRVRALIERELPAYFARIRDLYAPEGAASRRTVTPAERAWGLMPPAAYGAIVLRTFQRDWVPRFGKRQIDARAAFRAL